MGSRLMTADEVLTQMWAAVWLFTYVHSTLAKLQLWLVDEVFKMILLLSRSTTLKLEKLKIELLLYENATSFRLLNGALLLGARLFFSNTFFFNSLKENVIGLFGHFSISNCCIGLFALEFSYIIYICRR